MRKTINKYDKEVWEGATVDTPLDPRQFHVVPDDWAEDSIQFALHTNLGSLTVLDRMTGFGYRDVETGYRDPDGQFWLASGNYDVRDSGAKTLGEAIAWVKENANTCIPEVLCDMK